MKYDGSNPLHVQQARAKLEKLIKEQKVFELTEKKPQRSLNQNKYLWLLIEYWATQTGYIPVRESAINSDEYKNTGSLIAPIIADATKNLFTNPLVKGMDSAYRESNTVLESVLAEKNPDVKSKLEAFKSTLMSIWE